MSTQEGSSRTSEDDSLAQSSSLQRDSIITYSDEIADSSALGTSVVTYNNNEKSRNAPSSKQGNAPPFYYRKRFWAMCVAVNVVLTAIFIPLIYLVILPSVAQSTINKSQLDFDSITITNETDDGFLITTKGETTKAGPFHAKIEFNGPVRVLFNDKELGTTEIGDFSISNGRGSVVGTTERFKINDKPQFTNFASTTMTAKSFKWTIIGSVNVRTFGTKIKNLSLHKDVIIPGSNGYNTTLIGLKIGRGPDNSSLSLDITTNLYNPSPIAIEIGDMYLQLVYNGTVLANAVAKNVFIKSKDNIINMTGISQIPTSLEDKYNYIKVISGYLTNSPVNTQAKVLYVISPNGEKIGWLNDAAQSLNLSTTIGQVKAPPLMSGVDFGEMNIKFTPDAPFSPTISAKGATANLSLPFDIDFKVSSVSQNLTLIAQGKSIATIATPQSNVTTTGKLLSLDIAETQMIVDKDSEDLFQQFFANVTTGKGSDVIVAGLSNAIVSSVIGDNVPIEGLPINVSTTIQGFNQFNSDGNPPTVDGVTVLAGTSNELIIGAIVTLANPTRYSTSIGQVTLNLFYREQQIGNVVIQDLTVVPGPNPLTVVITLNDPENNAGKELMTSFITNQPISLEIRGFEGSTNIASLASAFKAVDISSTLPSLPQNQQLVSSPKIVIDNQTSTPYGIVDIVNTFVAPISIYTMNSSFSFNGNILGSYEQDMSNNPIFIPGNSVQRLQLPVNMNFDPAASFTVLRTLALQNNMDVSVLDSLIVLSKVNVPGVDPNVQPTPEAIRSFDLGKFITTALAKIPVTINMNARVAIGYYFMSMSYQQDVVVETDSSILSLIPKIAQPMIGQFLSQSQMNIDTIFVHNIDVSSFNLDVNGLISNTGPLPASASFPNGIDVSSGGVALGKIVNMQPVTVDPLAGAKLNGTSEFIISDIPTFTSFVGSLLGGSAFTGDISGDIVITSFGTHIGPIPIKQSISVGGLGGNFQDAAKVVGGSLTGTGFSANVALSNPSMFGIELGKVVFDLFSDTEQLSTVTGDNVVIVPKGVSTIALEGTLSSQLLTTIVAKSPITIQGESITPPKATGEVVWLTEPFKSFKISAPFDLSTLGGAASPAP